MTSVRVDSLTALDQERIARAERLVHNRRIALNRAEAEEAALKQVHCPVAPGDIVWVRVQSRDTLYGEARVASVRYSYTAAPRGNAGSAKLVYIISAHLKLVSGKWSTKETTYRNGWHTQEEYAARQARIAAGHPRNGAER